MLPLNPTVKLVIALVLVGAVGALKALEVAMPSWASWAGTVVQVLTVAEVYFTVPASAALKLKAAAVKPLTLLMLVAVVVLCSGCLSSAPIVPVTPANQAQVTSCENTASLHDGLVVGDFVLTGGATTLGAIGALESSTQAKTDLAIAAAGAAGVGVVASSLVAITASNFANSQCSSVVGQLPTSQPGAGK